MTRNGGLPVAGRGFKQEGSVQRTQHGCSQAASCPSTAAAPGLSQWSLVEASFAAATAASCCLPGLGCLRPTEEAEPPHFTVNGFSAGSHTGVIALAKFLARQSDQERLSRDCRDKGRLEVHVLLGLFTAMRTPIGLPHCCFVSPGFGSKPLAIARIGKELLLYQRDSRSSSRSRVLMADSLADGSLAPAPKTHAMANFEDQSLEHSAYGLASWEGLSDRSGRTRRMLQSWLALRAGRSTFE